MRTGGESVAGRGAVRRGGRLRIRALSGDAPANASTNPGASGEAWIEGTRERGPSRSSNVSAHASYYDISYLPAHDAPAELADHELEPAEAPARGSGIAIARTTASVGSLLLADQALKAIVPHTLPPQLLGMAAILALMLSLDAFGLHNASVSIRSSATPGITFISRWLPCFYAPSIVRLPVAISSLTSSTIASMIGITVVCFVMTLALAGATTSFIRSLTRTRPDDRPPQPPGKPYTPAELGFLASVGIAGMIVAAMYPSSVFMQRVGIGMTLCSATAGSYATATLLPESVQTLLHPLLVCGLAGNAVAYLCSYIAGKAWSYTDVLNSYVVKWKNGVFGGGDVLMLFLGPVILSFAFKVYDERHTMKKHFAELVTGSAIASLFSLLVTVLAGRLLGLDPFVSRAIAPRSVTAALAAPAAVSLGAPSSFEPITLAMVVLTGLVGGMLCVPLTRMLGMRDIITRGMATAASAHGVGTATLCAVQPSAMPFCALTYVLSGIFATIYACMPPIQHIVAVLAGG